jgi:hypothetical protein
MQATETIPEQLNDQIFEQIKSLLCGNGTENNENNSLLYKICSGQATESEISEWNKTMPIDENKIKESCDLGYNLASKLDTTKTDELQIFRNEMTEMKKEIESLKLEVANMKEKSTGIDKYRDANGGFG